MLLTVKGRPAPHKPRFGRLPEAVGSSSPFAFRGFYPGKGSIAHQSSSVPAERLGRPATQSTASLLQDAKIRSTVAASGRNGMLGVVGPLRATKGTGCIGSGK
jgi:hypothetical protein